MEGKLKNSILVAVFIVLLPTISSAAITAKLLRVIDGDTIVAQTKTGKVTLRLAGIDCPEIKQPGGAEAKAFTEKSLSKGNFRYSSKGKDKYLRPLVIITTSKGRNLNISLIQKGHAWADPKLATKTIKTEEKKARKAKTGIWAGTPQAPWLHRASSPSTSSIPSVLKGIRLSSSASSAAGTAQGAGKPKLSYLITASDYKISRDVSQVNGEVRVSGRISNGPACDNLEVKVFAESTAGGIVSMIDMTSFSGTGSTLFDGSKKYYREDSEWFISRIYVTCTD